MGGRDFYSRPTAVVAQSLLGSKIIHNDTVGRIIETEAYFGSNDPASHASAGKTDRNASMFGSPGHAYVYKCYGIHTLFNVTTRESGSPGAVLIRAAEPLRNLDLLYSRRGVQNRMNLCDGPGKLCEAFDIRLSHDGIDVLEGSLRIEHGPTPNTYESTGRIGISEAQDRKLRFVATDSE